MAGVEEWWWWRWWSEIAHVSLTGSALVEITLIKLSVLDTNLCCLPCVAQALRLLRLKPCVVHALRVLCL